MPKKAAEVEGATVGAVYNIPNHGAFSVTKVRNGPREQIVEFAPEGAGESGEMGLSMWRKLANPAWDRDMESVNNLMGIACDMRVRGWPQDAIEAVEEVASALSARIGIKEIIDAKS